MYGGVQLQCSAMQRTAMPKRCNAMQCKATQCNAVELQCNVMQCNAMQRNAPQLSVTQCPLIRRNADCVEECAKRACEKAETIQSHQSHKNVDQEREPRPRRPRGHGGAAQDYHPEVGGPNGEEHRSAPSEAEVFRNARAGCMDERRSNAMQCNSMHRNA